MKRSQYAKEQVIHMLQEAQAGAAGAELCRRHAVGESTFYKWNQQFGGVKVDETRRLQLLAKEGTLLHL